MTFQEAQAKFSAIIASITTASPPPELLQKQQDLIRLQDSLPPAPEFDTVANAIADFSPKLTGAIVQGDLDALRSRETGIKEAANFLTQVSNKASADARTLTFETPNLVVATFTESVTKLQELRTAAKNGDFNEVGVKIDALVTLIQHVRGSIKAA